MTYPASGSGTIVNNFGPSTPNPGTVGVAPPFPSPAAASNVTQTNPSPPTFNSSGGVTSTQTEVAALTAARNTQVPWNTSQGNSDAPSPPGKNVAQTLPTAPSGTFAQSGTAYLVNAAAVLLAGVRQSDFTYYTTINDANG